VYNVNPRKRLHGEDEYQFGHLE
jgi:hypothetical protein